MTVRGIRMQEIETSEFEKDLWKVFRNMEKERKEKDFGEKDLEERIEIREIQKENFSYNIQKILKKYNFHVNTRQCWQGTAP